MGVLLRDLMQVGYACLFSLAAAIILLTTQVVTKFTQPEDALMGAAACAYPAALISSAPG